MATVEKRNNNKKVPNLRFKEFEGEWEEIILSELGNFIGGGTPSSSNNSFWDGNIPWISSSDLEENNIHSIKVTRFITKDALKNSSTKLCSSPVILVVSRVGVGKVAYSTESVCTSQDFTNIINLKCNGLFLSYLLSLRMKKVYSSIQGTSIKGISSIEIKSQKIFIPNNNEQNKIAKLLLLIDQRIQTQIKIINRLETSMLSLRERIFKQQIRFKDENGNCFPDWNMKKFGEIFSFKSTNSFSRENLNYEKGTVKNIHYGDIHTKFKTSFNISEEVVPYINEEILTSKISEDDYCKSGDMIFADASENLTDVGKSIEIVNLNNENVISGLHTLHARSLTNTFIIGFAAHMFKSKNVKTQIQKVAQGSKVLSISANRLFNVILNIPSHSEQNLITKLLSSYDEMIETEKKILEQYETQKKYLLQNMFI